MKETEQKPRLSRNDPVLVTINKLAKILEPYDRQQQLRAMAAACSILGHVDEAAVFLRAVKEEQEPR